MSSTLMSHLDDRAAALWASSELGKDKLSSHSIDRRAFLRATGAAGLLASALPTLAQSSTSLEAYAQSPSVRAGETLHFSVRDPAAGAGETSASVRVVRLAGWVDLTMHQAELKLRNHAVPADAASQGCRWPTAFSLPIPIGWPSGVYYAHFAVSPGSWCSIPFVVRPSLGAVAQAVLVVVPVSTAQAKNNYGGASLYDTSSVGGRRSGRVSFARPFAERWNYAFDPWQPFLARWLNRRSIQADFCTDLDVHDDAQLLNGVKLMLVAGHHAYWTREARQNFDARVAAGMNACLFSGQNMCWQSRLERSASGRALVCYKDAAEDPETRAAYKTVRWSDLTPAQPENSSIGLGSSGALTWLRGGARPLTPWSVKQLHWAFEGTALTQGIGLDGGPKFGGEWVGPFTDHASSSNLGAPDHMSRLASASLAAWGTQSVSSMPPAARSPSADMVIFSRNGGAGTVFNAGSSDWVRGLAPELNGLPASDVARITANLIFRLASGTHVESAVVWEARVDDRDGSLFSHFLGSNTWGPAASLREGFRAFAGSVPGAQPVYRHRAEQSTSPDGFRYLLSLQASPPAGWSRVGIAFYAYPSRLAGARPVFQYHLVQSATAPGARRFQYSLRGPAQFAGSPYQLDGVAFWTPLI